MSLALAVLMLSMSFGGLQYACFAAVLFFAIGRLYSPSKLKSFALWVPILFVPVQVLGWLGYLVVTTGSVGDWTSVFPGAAYLLILGYVYVALALLAHKVFAHFGWVHDGIAPQPYAAADEFVAHRACTLNGCIAALNQHPSTVSSGSIA